MLKLGNYALTKPKGVYMDMSNYNVIAAVKSLRKHLYIYHSKVLVKAHPSFNKLREQSRIISKRMARIIVRDLQEYRRRFPELYACYIKEV